MNTLNVILAVSTLAQLVTRGGKNDLTKLVTFENHKKSIAAEKRTQRINSLVVKDKQLFFWSSPKFWQKNAPILSEELFLSTFGFCY